MSARIWASPGSAAALSQLSFAASRRHTALILRASSERRRGDVAAPGQARGQAGNEGGSGEGRSGGRQRDPGSKRGPGGVSLAGGNGAPTPSDAFGAFEDEEVSRFLSGALDARGGVGRGRGGRGMRGRGGGRGAKGGRGGRSGGGGGGGGGGQREARRGGRGGGERGDAGVAKRGGRGMSGREEVKEEGGRESEEDEVEGTGGEEETVVEQGRGVDHDAGDDAIAGEREGEVAVEASSVGAVATGEVPGSMPGMDGAPPAPLSVEDESLVSLGWAGVCRQVAFFCQTPRGFLGALGGGVRVGRTREESEALLGETREAMAMMAAVNSAPLPLHALSSVLDVAPALRAARAGRVFTPRQAQGVADTVAALAEVAGAVMAARGALARGAEVAGVALGDQEVASLSRLASSLSRCVSGGRVADGADPSLPTVRGERRANAEELRRKATEMARALFATGALERPQVVQREGRSCLAVRSGRMGELSRGAVVLGTSKSGQTLFAEPPELVERNNREQDLSSMEAEIEERVLRGMTRDVDTHADLVLRAVSLASHVDMAQARARHAAWMRSSDVRLCGAGEAPLHLPGCRHPVMMEAGLPPLPQAPPSLLMEFESDYLGPVGTLGGPKGADGEGREGAAGGQWDEARMPRPVDWVVPEGTRVVAITGPNTGGKTASLLALGLASLMARAGLFLPCSASMGLPRVPWFDAVLADIGDSQSLEQSLSTFSGHVRRCSRILSRATPQSLVLLDEVGSGTDPDEGAALACSILLHLRDTAALTVATTHHAETKAMAGSEPGFARASVGFDTQTLRPAYALLWGTAGASNALDIAQALGFDPAVVEEARAVAAGVGVRALAMGSSGARGGLAAEVAEAQQEAEAARGRLSALHAALDETRARRAEVEGWDAGAAAESVAGEVGEEAARWVAEAERGQVSVDAAISALAAMAGEARERVAAAAPEWARAGGDGVDGAGEAGGGREGWRPSVGQRVLVAGAAGAEGVVRAVGDAWAVVAMGAVETRVGKERLRPWDPQGAEGARGGGGAGGGQARGKGPERLAAAAEAVKQRWKWAGRGRAGGAVALAGAGGGGGGGGPAIATSRNTVDVRGMGAEEAAEEAARAVGAAGAGGTVFIVHGVGTGRVRDAVRELLARDARVASVAYEEGSQGGCSVVTLA